MVYYLVYSRQDRTSLFTEHYWKPMLSYNIAHPIRGEISTNSFCLCTFESLCLLLYSSTSRTRH